MQEREYCIFYAKNISGKVLQKELLYFKYRFEMAKYNKHFGTGKTTRHRKTTKEKKLGKLRRAVRLCSRIVYYKKLIKENKLIAENNIEIKKPLRSFLLNE